jgi:hypothetical protein
MDRTNNQAEIVCNEKVVLISLPSGESLVVNGKKTSTITGIISFLKAQKCLQKGHTTILAVLNEKPSEERKNEDIPVVRDFPDMFQNTCQVFHLIDKWNLESS